MLRSRPGDQTAPRIDAVLLAGWCCWSGCWPGWRRWPGGPSGSPGCGPRPGSPPAAPPRPPSAATAALRLVDAAGLATVEFAPPPELTPAQGGVLLAEAVRHEHKVAWLALVAVGRCWPGRGWPQPCGPGSCGSAPRPGPGCGCGPSRSGGSWPARRPTTPRRRPSGATCGNTPPGRSPWRAGPLAAGGGRIVGGGRRPGRPLSPAGPDAAVGSVGIEHAAVLRRVGRRGWWGRRRCRWRRRWVVVTRDCGIARDIV